MQRLVVRLLGGFQVELDGQAVYAFRTDKARALLAYLVVESARPHRRETLAALLWPDRPDAVARANLRQALSYVRQALGDSQSHDSPSTGPGPQGQESPSFLLITPTDVQFNAASDHTLDVNELEACAASPERGEHGRTLAPLQLLPESYCADFLAGMAVSDSEAFQAWVLDRQEYYHRLTLDILDAQAAHFEAAGDYGQAVAAARLQLRMEPWLEEAHQRCMRNLALAGRRDEALHQYEACCRTVEAELAAEPSDSTRSLYADIRDGRLAAPRGRRSDAYRGEVTSPLPWTAPLSFRDASRIRLVAREDELGLLGSRLDAALAGETAVAFVSGDAGSGKTALLEAFAVSALEDHPDLLVAGARCGPGGRADPFGPLRRLAEVLFGDLNRGVAWHPAGQEEVERLAAATGLTLACLEEQGPDLAGKLVPAASIARRAGLSGGMREWSIMQGALAQGPLTQGAVFDQLLCTLAAIAAERPLLLLLDDLHWVDDATAAFLLHLGRELAGGRSAPCRMLVLGAYRPEPLGMRHRDLVTGETSRHSLASAIDELRQLQGEIVLELDRADGRAFVEAYVDTEPNRLGARFRDALYAHTGGHALFTVESLRNLRARGQLYKDEAGRWVVREPLEWGSLPARVEAAIAERIERLPEPERAILSCASVQGDDFTGELVAAIIGKPLREVLTCLSGSLARQHHLVRPEGLDQAPAQPGIDSGQRSLYRFTHHLFQKYLYDQLDVAERGRLHVAIAAALDRQAGDDPAERERLSLQLAWHYEAGGLPLQAARALHDAGQLAMRVSAMREAMNLYEHGLALLAEAAPPRERSSTEWSELHRRLELARLGPRRHLEGMGTAGLAGAEVQASAAGPEEAGGPPRLMLLWAQTEHLLGTGQFEAALAVAGRLLAEAGQCGDEDFAVIAALDCGLIHHYAGQPRESESALERLLTPLTPERRASPRPSASMHRRSGWPCRPSTGGSWATRRRPSRAAGRRSRPAATVASPSGRPLPTHSAPPCSFFSGWTKARWRSRPRHPTGWRRSAAWSCGRCSPTPCWGGSWSCMGIRAGSTAWAATAGGVRAWRLAWTFACWCWRTAACSRPAAANGALRTAQVSWRRDWPRSTACWGHTGCHADRFTRRSCAACRASSCWRAMGWTRRARQRHASKGPWNWAG